MPLTPGQASALLHDLSHLPDDQNRLQVPTGLQEDHFLWLHQGGGITGISCGAGVDEDAMQHIQSLGFFRNFLTQHQNQRCAIRLKPICFFSIL